jgi:hypothetical protein
MAATSYYENTSHTTGVFGHSPQSHDYHELEEHAGPSSPPAHSYTQSDSNFLTPPGADSSIHREPSQSSALSGSNRFTYIDEDFNYYPSHRQAEPSTYTQAPLVYNAADIGRSGPGDKSTYQDLGMLSDIIIVLILIVSQNTLVIKTPSR